MMLSYHFELLYVERDIVTLKSRLGVTHLLIYARSVGYVAKLYRPGAVFWVHLYSLLYTASWLRQEKTTRDKVLKGSALGSFKVIHGYRNRYQSKAHMRLPISLPM